MRDDWQSLKMEQMLVCCKMRLVRGRTLPTFEQMAYLRLIDFVYHSTRGLRVIKKRRRLSRWHARGQES